MLSPAGPVVIDWANSDVGRAEVDVALTALILAQVANVEGALAVPAGVVLESFLDHAGPIDRADAEAAASYRAGDPNQTPAELAVLSEAVRLVSRWCAGLPILANRSLQPDTLKGRGHRRAVPAGRSDERRRREPWRAGRAGGHPGAHHRAAQETVPGVAHASISLRHADGRLETKAATNPLVDEADRIQHELAEGPCYDAVTDSLVTYSPDLAHASRMAALRVRRRPPSGSAPRWHSGCTRRVPNGPA